MSTGTSHFLPVLEAIALGSTEVDVLLDYSLDVKYCEDECQGSLQYHNELVI